MPSEHDSQPKCETCDGFSTKKISLLTDAFVHTCRDRTCSFRLNIDANYKMTEIEVVTGNNSDMFFSRFQKICSVI